MPLTNTMRQTIKQKLRSFRKAVAFVRRRRRPSQYNQKVQQSGEVLKEDNDLRKQVEEHQDKVEKSKQENLLLKEELENQQTLSEKDKKLLGTEIELLKNELNEKQIEIEKMKKENIMLKKEYEMKELHVKEALEKNFEEKKCKLEQELFQLKQDLQSAQENMAKNIFGNDNNGTLEFVKGGNILIEEVKSLRSVLDLKQSEIKDMRLALAGTKQKEEALHVAEKRILLQRARCEDLQEQLRRKAESERNLEKEIIRLRRIALEENAENKKLSCQIDELQWTATEEVLQNTVVQTEQDLHLQMSMNKTPNRVVRKRQSICYTFDFGDGPDTNKKNKIYAGRIEKQKRIKSKCEDWPDIVASQI